MATKKENCINEFAQKMRITKKLEEKRSFADKKKMVRIRRAHLPGTVQIEKLGKKPQKKLSFG